MQCFSTTDNFLYMENSRLCILAKAIIRVAAQSLTLVHRQHRSLPSLKPFQHRKLRGTLQRVLLAKAAMLEATGSWSGVHSPAVRPSKDGKSKPWPQCAARVPGCGMNDQWQRPPNETTPEWIYKVYNKGPWSETRGPGIAGLIP